MTSVVCLAILCTSTYTFTGYYANTSVCLPSSLDATMISSILSLSLIADISLLSTCSVLPDPGNEAGTSS